MPPALQAGRAIPPKPEKFVRKDQERSGVARQRILKKATQNIDCEIEF
jgi:hypothetical protein